MIRSMQMTDITQALSSHPEFDHHHKIIEFKCNDTGLHAIIAIHNINLGPSLGGCRFYPYATRDDAITDVLRLSKGMTYKSALAGLALGGGKSVIIGDPKKIRTAEMIRRFGQCVASLNGDYIVAEDIGTTEHDMVEIAKETTHVAGLPNDGSNNHVTGNPSPITALGTYYGIKSAVKFKLNRDNISGLHIAIQGLGAVGYALAEYLLKDGARLTVADLNEQRINDLQAQYPDKVSKASVDEILQIECDVLAPCAMGAILNDNSITQLKTSIIAGAANNQLKAPHHDQMLKDLNILYAPDYAINSGGVTSVGYEYFARANRNPYAHELTMQHMLDHVAKIEQTMTRIFQTANAKNIPTGKAANQLAEELFKDNTL